MKIYECDDSIGHLYKVCCAQLNGLSLDCLHFKYQNYLSIINSLDMEESGFQYWYKKFIKNNISNKISSYRTVYSRIPSVVCYLPKYGLYHKISHPFINNSYSVFCPLTRWISSNTICVKHRDVLVPLDVEETNIFFMLDDTDSISIPNNKYQMANTSFGLFFTIMTYDSYKQNNLIESTKKIGTFFGLL
jgi:hypothetical protein